MHKQPSRRLFNTVAIERSLEGVRLVFDQINDRLDNRREPLTKLLIANILEAYEYLNGLLSKNFDLFSPAGLYSMLELNHIILCGADQRTRIEYHIHIQETRKRFQSIMKDIYQWYLKKGRNQETFKKAANFYVRALSQPQLFLEGNHRTENIIINYLLLSEGFPPFILSVENALEYFNPSTGIKFSSKLNLLDNVTTQPGFAKDFKKMLERNVDERYLL